MSIRNPLLSRDNRETISVLMLARQLGWGGGIERDVSKFARHLSKFDIVPHVVCFNGGGTRWSEIEAAGIPVRSLEIKSFKSSAALSGMGYLRRYAAENHIQVLHAFDAPSNIYGVPLARLIGIPLALSSHLWRREMLPVHMRILLAAVDVFATGLFVNCHEVANDLASNWHISPDRIHVCHNGYEPEEFHGIGRARPADLADASVVFGTVAVLRQEKNVNLLLDAFARVQAADSNSRLLIVGDGPMKAALQQQARKLRIAGACLFKDATPTPADWMRAIDVFVLPSLSEAFPNALLEAMACGCCPVASRVGGTGELVSHGENGYLFESDNSSQLADALCTLTLNPDLRKQMAHSAARFVRENLTIDIAASRLASIYRHLLATGQGTPAVTAKSVRDTPDHLARKFQSQEESHAETRHM